MPPHVDLTVLETLDEEPRPIIVNVATLKADQRDRAFFALVKLLFFTERPRFFQFSITGDVYSVVGSPEDLRELAESSCALEVDTTPWNVVRVSEGALIDSESGGVVERIVAPLAASRISVLYISTYAADYVLIPCDQLDDAMRLLGHGDDDPQAAEAATRVAAGAAERVRYPLSVLERARIFQIERQSRQLQTGALLRLFFLPLASDPPYALRTLIETPDELSCVCDDVDWLDDPPAAGGLVHGARGETWVPIRIGDEEGTPLDEIGLVAMYAAALRDAGLTIMYLGGTSDCVMVREADLPRAIEAFEAGDFTICLPDGRVINAPEPEEAVRWLGGPDSGDLPEIEEPEQAAPPEE